MGDEHEGDPDFSLQRFEFLLHLLAQFEVERAERLVEQQHLGLVHQRTGQSDPLLLAAGELRGSAVCHPGELHHFDGLVDAFGDLRFLDFAHP